MAKLVFPAISLFLLLSFSLFLNQVHKLSKLLLLSIGSYVQCPQLWKRGQKGKCHGWSWGQPTHVPLGSKFYSRIPVTGKVLSYAYNHLIS